jgi:hypothetical protein
MPASESRQSQRNASPGTESPHRGLNNEVAESASGRKGRKKGKNAVQKETNAAKDADSTMASEWGGSPATVRVERDDSTAPKSSPQRSNFVTSAVLDALHSAEKVSDPDDSNLTSVWAPSMSFSRSPPTDLLEDMAVGTSPPNFTTATERGGFSSKTPPSSPPMRKSRPISYGTGIYSAQARHSLSEKSLRLPQQSFAGSSPPLPHLPQAHFYSLPDIDLGAGTRLRDMRSDEPARFLGFAELPSLSPRQQKHHAKAVLLGSEDRLDVVALEKDKLTALGALEGIGGTIVDAKVLTWDHDLDPFRHIRPLVALIVHGPRPSDHAPPGISEGALLQDKNATGNPTKATESTGFQTTVVIYSLSTQELVAALMWSQPSLGLPNMRGLPVSVPPPVGNLKLDTGGNFFTVSSGTSGEIFIFGAESDTAEFRCIGKVWTSVQTLHDRRYSNSSNSTDPDVSPADLNRNNKSTQLPIMSLNRRWLAVVPPGPIACQPLPVTVESKLISTIVPGLDSRNAPPRPPVSCALESPDAESFINRVARGVAQEFVRGARWLGGQGLQTWNNYWSRDANAQTSAHSRNIYQTDTHLPAGMFPPTHAPESRPTSAEPQLVSIIDLQELANASFASNSDTVIPLATFQPPNGVSFLSFSPDGLAIISATHKGDVQYVWDLKQSRHLRASTLLANADSETSAKFAKVTQLAKFARLTPSKIIDIEWKGPSGDQFAVITKNGTIHVFDLPLSAFQWPSFRRSVRVVPSSAPASPAVNAQPDEPTPAGSVFSSAIKLAGKTQPMLSSLRGRAPSIGMVTAGGSGNNSIGFASATSIRGSKVVAAGLSRSVGAATGTVSSLRHAGDNRLHLNSLARNPAPSRVCWSQDRERSALLVVDSQCIKSFRVSKRRASAKAGRQPLSAIDSNPTLTLALPASEQLVALGGSSRPVADHGAASGEGLATGYWALLPSSKQPPTSRIVHPLSCAEIETNAPYQPFHSDRRVNLFVYRDRYAEDTLRNLHEPWIFGNDMATTRLDIRPPTVSDEEELNSGASVLYRHMSTTTGEVTGGDEGIAGQVVVTTRRRKNKTPHQSMLAAGVKVEQDDGFFEDDCDVLDFAEDRV